MGDAGSDAHTADPDVTRLLNERLVAASDFQLFVSFCAICSYVI